MVKQLQVREEGRKEGISVLVAVLFIVGEIAGTGILAFPESMKGVGWFGPLAIAIGCLGGGYAGVLLGNSWLILETRDPSLQDVKTRNPYPLIGLTAAGRVGRATTTLTLIIMLFGSAVVQMLIFAETVHSLIPETSFLSLSFCKWIVLAGVVLLPFSLLGSPVDFWPVALFAMSSTTIACVLIVIAALLEDTTPAVAAVTADQQSAISLKSVLLGFSTIIFGYGGASALPTIQNDMRDKKGFSVAVMIAFGIMLTLYLPVSVIGYWKFGSAVKSNIVRNLTPSPLVTLIQCLITAHVFCAFLIQLNPVNLTIESMLSLDHSFNWKRCLSRSCIIALTILTGQAVPKFGKLLNLLGAFSVTMQSYILPAIFYFLICPSKSFVVRIALLLMVLLGTLIAISSSFFALMELFSPQAFTTPCFLCDCVVLD